MTIGIPGQIDALLPWQLVQTPMAATPVDTALANCNHLWRYFSPPFIDVCPSQSFTSSGINQRYVVPAGFDNTMAMEHDFKAVVNTSTTATVGLEVEYTTAWVSFAGSSWTSLGSTSASINGVGTLTVNAAVPVGALAIRYKFACSTGNYTVHHLLAIPADDTITSNGKQFLFVAYDDGLLESGDQPPISTEMLNRVTRNCAGLRRRRQAALSYVQPESATYGQSPVSTANHVIARCRIWLGARDGATLTVRAIGSNSGQKLRIVQVPADGQPIAGGQMELDMDGTRAAGSMELVAQGAGVLRFADVLVWLVGTSTTLYTLHGWVD